MHTVIHTVMYIGACRQKEHKLLHIISMHDPLVSVPQNASCSSRSDPAEGRDVEVEERA